MDRSSWLSMVPSDPILGASPLPALSRTHQRFPCWPGSDLRGSSWSPESQDQASGASLSAQLSSNITRETPLGQRLARRFCTK